MKQVIGMFSPRGRIVRPFLYGTLLIYDFFFYLDIFDICLNIFSIKHWGERRHFFYNLKKHNINMKMNK